MRSSIWVPLIAGLAAGIFALYQFTGFMERKNQEAKKLVDHETIVVAKTDIPYAMTIEADQVTTVQMVKPNPLQNTIGKLEGVTGRVSAAGIVAGLPILTTMLAPEHTPPGAQHQIKAGYRPVTVTVEAFDVQHLLPGDHVDVLFSEKGRSATGLRTMKPILQNVEVFSVDELRPGMMNANVVTEADKKKAKPAAGQPTRAARGGQVPVQLLLTTDKAQKLSVAILNGDLQLLQRAYGDNAPLAEEMDIEEIVAAGRKEQEGSAPQDTGPVMVPVFNVVKVLQGGAESEVPFQVGEVPAPASTPAPPKNEANKPKSPQASLRRETVPDVAEHALRDAKEREEGNSGE